MPEAFNSEEAKRWQDEYIREAQRIRDSLTRDVVDYYYDSYPDTEEKYQETVAGMKKYLRTAVEEINTLLDRLY